MSILSSNGAGLPSYIKSMENLGEKYFEGKSSINGDYKVSIHSNSWKKIVFDLPENMHNWVGDTGIIYYAEDSDWIIYRYSSKSWQVISKYSDHRNKTGKFTYDDLKTWDEYTMFTYRYGFMTNINTNLL